MSDNIFNRRNDNRTTYLINNPNPRVPVCLILDTSGSMSGDPIEELNDGVELFLDAIKSDEKARWAAEIAIISFGGVVNVCSDFQGVDRINFKRFYADGGTPMEEGVMKGIELLEKRKNDYKTRGVPYYQPWMVIMSDGYPDYEPSKAYQITYQMSQNRKLVCLPLGVQDADMQVLSKFSTKPALKLRGINFKDFFEWLSKSVQAVSQSATTDAEVVLPKIDWGTIEN
ncbi:vWA domain-containing protein [Brachyspira alvinipulli]|uniref:vWA domain-containing protein n=1 Tax=Brachyspira alvinipulli TaxID=84379 RepID=UPI0004BA1B18|nr:VWA domain-containing protein [Brachyspira alvinipulli]